MRKIIKVWCDDVKVGIWDDEWELKLYEDAAILHMPYVKWVNNSGTLATHVAKFQADSKQLQGFLTIAREEIEDGEDYTERIRELIWSY
ncbi:MAG: hypothetical protein M0R00_05225 [Candidatus Omnitrophica bacterium]|jgi:hypothetical protein|nr:hypothetical protein [Candidatus Omnitrophota bacterium]